MPGGSGMSGAGGEADGAAGLGGVDRQHADLAGVEVGRDDALRDDPDGVGLADHGAAEGIRHGLDLDRDIADAVGDEEALDDRAG